MGKHGGKRDNAGRKKKDEERQIIETLSPLHAIALEKYQEALETGKDWAVKLFFEYYYGKPTQTVNQQMTFNESPAILFKKIDE